MKKICSTLLLAVSVLTLNAQTWDKNIYDNWIQTSKVKSNVFTNFILYVNLISDQKANVTVDNNSITTFALKPISNGGLETTSPLEVKNIYGYDAKKVFIRFYNQNNVLRVVRKIYEYDRNGEILNQSSLDSVLFKRKFSYVIPQNPNVEGPVKNPLNLPGGPPKLTKALLYSPVYKISDIKFETLHVDEDVNCNGTENSVTAKTSEFFADLKMKIYKNASSLNVDLGQILYQQYKGNLGSAYILELQVPKASTENYKNTFSVSQSDFDETRIRFIGEVSEINAANEFESGCPIQNDNLLGKTAKPYQEIYLKDLFVGENFIDLKGRHNTLRVHFTIKPN